MDPLSIILVFIFGAVIGSFLNVVAIRFNTGSNISGRSKCMSCGNQLTWKELIPIFSFAVQGGSCKKCKSKISWQYPLVEFAAGVIFTLIFVFFPPIDGPAILRDALYLIISALLLVITVYDVKHKIIPNSFVYSFAGLSILALFFGGATWFHTPSIWALLAGPILALPFALIWLASGGTWMGLGDAKLVLGIGWLLGLNGGANAIILSFWIAAIISIAWLLHRYKSFKPKTEIPFGPYLILGMYIVLFYNVRVIDLTMLRDILMFYL